MKKVFTFIAAVAFVASLSSCKKDYTCTCTVSGGGVSGSSSVTWKAKKKDAEDSCTALEVASGGSTTKCELKKN